SRRHPASGARNAPARRGAATAARPAATVDTMGRIVGDLSLTSGSKPARNARRVVLRAVDRSDHAPAPSPVTWSVRASHAMKAPAVIPLPIAALLFWAWFLGAEKRVITGLTDDQRKAAYATALHAFEVMCSSRLPGLEEPCHDQARLLISFPDCDAQC